MNEALSTKDAKKLNKASMLSTSTNPKDQDRARARQTEVDYKDLVRQLKAKRKMKNESFTIDKSAHKSAQKKAKLRNLAKGNTNPNEKAAAEKKAGGPKLIGERLGGKGYKRRKDYAGRTVEGDWPDSDRGAGNKATRRAGGKVKKKSPTYQAYVLNKEEDNYGQAKKELKATKKARDERHRSIHSGTNTAKNTDVNEAKVAEKKKGRHPRDQKELDRAQEYIKKNPKFGKVSEAKVDKGRSDYGKASIRNYRRSGPGHGEPAMFDPENKRGKLIDKRREEHKARRGVKKAKVPAYKVSEGKTFDAWKKAAASALGRKKKQEKKPSMDSTTRKLHKWRTDKEQAEREKYVTFTKPVEDD